MGTLSARAARSEEQSEEVWAPCARRPLLFCAPRPLDDSTLCETPPVHHRITGVAGGRVACTATALRLPRSRQKLCAA